MMMKLRLAQKLVLSTIRTMVIITSFLVKNFHPPGTNADGQVPILNPLISYRTKYHGQSSGSLGLHM
jgi:hypothetical protein